MGRRRKESHIKYCQGFKSLDLYKAFPDLSISILISASVLSILLMEFPDEVQLIWLLFLSTNIMPTTKKCTVSLLSPSAPSLFLSCPLFFCCTLNAHILPKPPGWNLTANKTVVGHGGPMNQIRALIKEAPETPLPFHYLRTQGENK